MACTKGSVACIGAVNCPHSVQRQLEEPSAQKGVWANAHLHSQDSGHCPRTKTLMTKVGTSDNSSTWRFQANSDPGSSQSWERGARVIHPCIAAWQPRHYSARLQGARTKVQYVSPARTSDDVAIDEINDLSVEHMKTLHPD